MKRPKTSKKEAPIPLKCTKFPISSLPAEIRSLILDHLLSVDLLRVNSALRFLILSKGTFGNRLNEIRVAIPDPTRIVVRSEGEETTNVDDCFRRICSKIRSTRLFSTEDIYHLETQSIPTFNSIFSNLKFIGNFRFYIPNRNIQEIRRSFSDFQANITNQAHLSFDIELSDVKKEFEEMVDIFSTFIRKHLMEAKEIVMPADICLLEALRESLMERIELWPIRYTHESNLEVIRWILENGNPSQMPYSSLHFKSTLSQANSAFTDKFFEDFGYEKLIEEPSERKAVAQKWKQAYPQFKNVRNPEKKGKIYCRMISSNRQIIYFLYQHNFFVSQQTLCE